MAGVGAAFTKAYSSNSGCDMIMRFDNWQVNTVIGLTISITREKVPVYTMGNKNPRSISRGKRSLAGSIQMQVFDREPMYELMNDPEHQFYAHGDDINWLKEFKNNPFKAAVETDEPVKVVKTPARYLDEMLPVDVTIVMANEYGNIGWGAIVGIEFLNEATSYSMDDASTQTSSTYIALHKEHFRPIDIDGDNTRSITEASIYTLGQIINNYATGTGEGFGSATVEGSTENVVLELEGTADTDYGVPEWMRTF